MKNHIFPFLFSSLLINTSCQVRDPVPLKAGDETNKFMDKRNQKSGGANDGKLPDPNSVQHSLLALERQSQLAQLLVLSDDLSKGVVPVNACLKVQATKNENSTVYFVDLNNCRFDYDQASQSQSGRLQIETKNDFIRIQTLPTPDSLRLKTTVRKAGRPTFISEDLLIEVDKITSADVISYDVKTFAISSGIKSKNENSELHMKASGLIQLTKVEKDLSLESKLLNWSTSISYQSDANNGTDWTLNLEMLGQDFISENLNICGSRKASLHLTYNFKPSDSKSLAELTFKDNVIALEKEKAPIFIQAPDCTKSAKPGAGILALPWGRVIL